MTVAIPDGGYHKLKGNHIVFRAKRRFESVYIWKTFASNQFPFYSMLRTSASQVKRTTASQWCKARAYCLYLFSLEPPGHFTTGAPLVTVLQSLLQDLRTECDMAPKQMKTFSFYFCLQRSRETRCDWFQLWFGSEQQTSREGEQAERIWESSWEDSSMLSSRDDASVSRNFFASRTKCLTSAF